MKMKPDCNHPRSKVLHLFVGLFAGVFIASILLVTASKADEFRVENSVFSGNSQNPITESTTIFVKGLVYDFLKDPPEITLFDAANRRFVLLDLSRRVKTELRTDQVAAFLGTLKTWALNHQDSFIRFTAEPQLSVSRDEETREYLLESPWLSYRVKAEHPVDPVIVTRYREFSDWYCQLNTMLNPGSRLPFPRLLLSRVLAENGELPSEVHLTLKKTGGILGRQQIFRSRHQFIYHLVQADRDRVSQAEQFLAIFMPVTFIDYQKHFLRQ